MRTRVGIGDSDEPAASAYEKVGAEWFETLVARFYAGVAEDPLLRPLYVDEDPSLANAQRDLAEFLVQFFGGPTTYSDRKGHPRLRARHAPFSIGSAERDAWLHHMRSALEATDGPDDVVAQVAAYVEHAAEFLRVHD